MRTTPTLLLAAALAVAGCSATAPVDPPPPPVDPPAPPPPVEAAEECVEGMAGAFGCSGVDLVAQVTLDEFGEGTSRGNDIWGWTDPESGVEYALVGLDDGTVFVSMEDPTAPVVLGKLPTTTTAVTWRDIKTYADHAYIGSEAPQHGMQVFDLTRLRGLEASDPIRIFEPDVLFTDVGSSHNVVIDEESGFAYLVGFRPNPTADLPAACDVPGFMAVDIREPKNPTFAGCFSDAAIEVAGRTAGYTHDAQCLVYRGPDADYQGRQLCFAANEDVVTVFDVEDKQNVSIISMAQYPGATYSHQGWLTSDQRYLLLDDELDEISGVSATQRTLVFDLADLDEPEFMYEWDSGLPVIDHNQYVVGNYSYQSNYKAGLRIIDVSRIGEGEMTEVGFFDTFPQGQDVQFGGQWSNFPYFESGLVIANDSQNGLFILQPTIDAPEM